MNNRLKQCPVCNSNLEIREYYCSKCDTTIRGNFDIGDLASLTPLQQEFVKVFICAQGSIKEVEKVLEVSYPTVKNKLKEIIEVLCPGHQCREDNVSEDILEEIEKGEISVDEAIKKIKKRS